MSAIEDRLLKSKQIQSGNPNLQKGEDIGGGWLDGILNLWGDIEDFFTGKQSQERQYLYDTSIMDEQNAFNERMMEKQNKFTQEMWNKENQYNSTQAQLNRWMEAGGNPNAFFGGGTNVGNASSVTGGNTSAGSGGNINSTAGVSQAAVQAIGQMAQNQQEIDIKKDNAFWQNRKLKAEAEAQEITNGTLAKVNNLVIKNAEWDIWKKHKEGIYTEAQTKQILEMLPLMKGKTSSEIEKLDQEKNNLIEECKEIKERTKNLKWQTKKAVQEEAALRWENWYRKAYKIDPHDGWGQMIVQAILGGKIKNIVTGAFSAVTESLEQTGEELIENMFRGVKGEIPLVAQGFLEQMKMHKKVLNRTKNRWKTILGK